MKKFCLIIVFTIVIASVSLTDEEKKNEWVCSECNGTGMLFTKCLRCKETGICKHCRGEEPKSCIECLGKKGKECKTCDGKGYKTRGISQSKKYPCRTCKGKGIIFCRKCKGEGKTICRYCQGSGRCPACFGFRKVPKRKCKVCGGEGGKWRNSDLKDLIKQNGGNTATEYAVLAGLEWLARHQNPDGSWGATSFQKQCEDTRCSGKGEPFFNIGLTGLASLAFTGAAYTPDSKDIYEGIRFGDVVRKAVLYLKDIQQAEGALGTPAKSKFMYNHAIATYALADLVALMKDKDEVAGFSLFKDIVQKAIDFMVSAQTPGKAWRYLPKDKDSDVSVTGWCAMALKTAEQGGLNVPKKVWAGIKSHLDDVTDEAYGYVGYREKGGVAILAQEKNAFENGNLYLAPSLTAGGIMMRILMGEKKKSDLIRNGAELLMKNLPAWDTAKRGKIDYYYWYHGSCALYKYDGPKGNYWREWNEAIKNVLLESQKNISAGCAKGSWDPVDRWSSDGGRVYSTAIAVLTLEVYYRLRMVKNK